MEPSVGEVCDDVNVGVIMSHAVPCIICIRALSLSSHATVQVEPGAILSHPVKNRVVSASSVGSAGGETTSVPDRRDTQALRAVVRGSAITLVVSIAADLFNTTLFALHPIFISVGFLGFMSEGVLLAHSFRLVDGPDRVEAIWRHALTQLAACVSIAIGFCAIYLNKVGLGKPHFTSAHGLLGASVTAAALLVVLMGAGAFRRLGLLQKLPSRMQPALKRAHTLAGALVWFAALCNVLLGLQTAGAGPRAMLHYTQSAGILLMAAAQGALLLQPRNSPSAKQA